MKTAVFPGSFNPFHQGHEEIVRKTLLVFDKVIIAQGINPSKSVSDKNTGYEGYEKLRNEFGNRIQFTMFSGLLADFVKSVKADAVIRGLRNADDLEKETTQQYWSEDLGMIAPTLYVICGRDKRHISSSAIRAVGRIKKKQ